MKEEFVNPVKEYYLNSPSKISNNKDMKTSKEYEENKKSPSKLIKHKSNNQFKVKLPNLDLNFHQTKNKKSFLNILHHKGKSIFENSVLDNALGTISSYEIDTFSEEKNMRNKFGKNIKNKLNSDLCNLNFAIPLNNDNNSCYNIIKISEKESDILRKTKNERLELIKNRENVKKYNQSQKKNEIKENSLENNHNSNNVNGISNITGYVKDETVFNDFIPNTFSHKKQCKSIGEKNNFFSFNGNYDKKFGTSIKYENINNGQIIENESENINYEEEESSQRKNLEILNEDYKKNSGKHYLNEYFFTANEIDFDCNKKFTNKNNSNVDDLICINNLSDDKINQDNININTNKNNFFNDTAMIEKGSLVTVEDFGTQYNFEEDLKFQQKSKKKNIQNYLRNKSLNLSKNSTNIEMINNIYQSPSNRIFYKKNLMFSNKFDGTLEKEIEKMEKFHDLIVKKNINVNINNFNTSNFINFNNFYNGNNLAAAYTTFDKLEKNQVREKFLLSPLNRRKISKNKSISDNNFVSDKKINYLKNKFLPIKKEGNKINNVAETKKYMNKVEMKRLLLEMIFPSNDTRNPYYNPNIRLEKTELRLPNIKMK